MPQFYDSLSPELTEWALKQSCFWTATAPLIGKHGVLGSALSIPGPNIAAYVDMTGSGAETISHLYENGRITLMFNSFETSPRIMRLFCRGKVVEAQAPRFREWISRMPGAEKLVGARAVIVLEIWKVQTSCGFGVPLLREGGGFEDRKTITQWTRKKVEKGEIEEYQRKNNADSLDGLPGLKSARKEKGEVLVWGDAKARMRRVMGSADVLVAGLLIGTVVGAAGVKSGLVRI